MTTADIEFVMDVDINKSIPCECPHWHAERGTPVGNAEWRLVWDLSVLCEHMQIRVSLLCQECYETLFKKRYVHCCIDYKVFRTSDVILSMERL